MSGPPYPPPPIAGSNAFGSFQIGVSQIGTIDPFDVWVTVQDQFANSLRLTTLIMNFAEYLDYTADFDQFYSLMWDIDTAQGYGLDVWGRIVGVSRVLQVPSGSYLGFQEAADPNETGWNQSPFYSGTGATTNFSLSDDAFRVVILAKAMANICDGSIPAINAILMSLFPGQGVAYCTNGLDMTMTYTFNWALTPLQQAIVEQSDVLPTPSGIKAMVVINP